MPSLRRAAEKGIVEGSVPNLVEGGLTHLQYADDTVLFLKSSNENIQNVKFLKINYNKAEVFTVGLGKVVAMEVADALNCKPGKLPMKYLEIPTSDVKLTKLQLSEPRNKIEKRLETWKCGQLSYGGRSILINSSLSSIPMYYIGFYWLYEGNHQKFDSVRGRFFWEGWQKRRNII
jgi:hypothetical protein